MANWKIWLQQCLQGQRHYRFLARHFLPPGDAEAASWLHQTMRFSGHLKIRELPPPGGRILVLAPHPDDEVLGPGGTLRGAARATLAMVYLTSGTPEETAMREEEARAVCRELGAEGHFLRLVDGGLATSGAAAQALAGVIKGFQPDVLMLPFMLDDHPDHRSASLLLAAACECLALEPEVWAYQVYSAMMSNVVVDITAWRGAKSDLIRYYQSQLARRDWVNFSLGLNAWNSRFLKTGNTAWAECFFVLPLAEYRMLTIGYSERLI